MHLFFFFFNDTATTEIYTLSLHDALPISQVNSSSRVHASFTGLPAALARRAASTAASPMCLPPYAEPASGTMTRTRSGEERKSTRLNSSHSQISHAVFCLEKKKTPAPTRP